MKKILLSILYVFMLSGILLPGSGCSKPKILTSAVKVTFSGPAGMKMSSQGKTLSVLTLKIMPGNYVFKFTAPGYKSAWKKYTISSADNNSTIKVDLEPERSVIMVTCSIDDTGKDANVMLTYDGTEQGTTPCLITGVTPGTHQLEFSHPGHASKTRQVTVTDSRPLPVIKEHLSSNSGTLQVNGKPAGAMLYINEKPVGPIPHQSKYIAGKYILELRSPGYITQKSEIQVIANQHTKSNIVLPPEPSSLYIESVPSNAVCVIRGQKRGTTPIKIDNLQPGNYKIELSLPGYETISEMIEVKAGSHEKLKLAMESGLGSARLNIRPAGVDILVDGKPVGRTEKLPGSEIGVKTVLLSNLTPGIHTCVISHPMAKPRTQKRFTFRVSKNKTTECLPVELWVPNCELTYRRNIKELVKLIRITDEEVEFELQPGISVTERRSNVQIRHLKSR